MAASGQILGPPLSDGPPARTKGHNVTLGALRPTFGTMSLTEAAFLLQGLFLVDLHQLQTGKVQGITRYLAPGSAPGGGRRLRYQRRDPAERWRNIREIWEYGGGDCEDLAAAVAAERTKNGHPSRPVIYVAGPGLAHAVVQDLRTKKLYDPSKLGGMGEVLGSAAPVMSRRDVSYITGASHPPPFGGVTRAALLFGGC